MSKKKHTPGPWAIRENSATIIAKDKGDCWVTRAKAYGHNPEEITANARLIAAAPEMLNALKEAHDFLIADGDAKNDQHLALLTTLQNSIALAEGEGI